MGAKKFAALDPHAVHDSILKEIKNTTKQISQNKHSRPKRSIEVGDKSKLFVEFIFI